MNVGEFTPDGDSGLYYRLEADDGGNLFVSVIEAGFDQAQSFRVHRDTAVAALTALSGFIDQAEENADRIEAAPLDTAVDTVQGESRVVRSVHHELSLDLKVAAGLSLNFRLSVAEAQRLHAVLRQLVPARGPGAPSL